MGTEKMQYSYDLPGGFGIQGQIEEKKSDDT